MEKTSKKKVLVIEDSEGIRLSLEIAFKNAGLEVVSAEDGKVGLDLAKKERPDLILLDLFLPVVDGFKVLTHLKRDADTEHTPVVIFSALSQENEKEEAMKLGAAGYIVKAEVSIDKAVKTALQYLR